MVKKTLLFLIMFFVIGTIACDDIDDLHGIWLDQEVFNNWQKGEDELLQTKIIDFAGEQYESIWIYLAINMKSTPKYFSYWGLECVITKMDRTETGIRVYLGLVNHKNATGVFDIVFLDRNTFRMTLVSLDAEFERQADNAYFTPNSLYPEEVYIRCPKKKVGAKTN